MHRHPLAAFLIAACHLIVAGPLLIVEAVERGVAFVWAWLAPAGPALDRSFDVDARAVEFAGDVPVDAALLNSLRHEAGMRPLRC